MNGKKKLIGGGFLGGLIGGFFIGALKALFSPLWNWWTRRNEIARAEEQARREERERVEAEALRREQERIRNQPDKTGQDLTDSMNRPFEDR
jgi:hypothetical protein